jgi:hypothetical protein
MHMHEGIAVHMHIGYLVHMHTADEKPATTGMSEPPTTKRVIGGITLYGPQLTKLREATADGTSRSAVLRQLIDQHL